MLIQKINNINHIILKNKRYRAKEKIIKETTPAKHKKKHKLYNNSTSNGRATII